MSPTRSLRDVYVNSLVYLTCVIAVVALGFASRRYASHLPPFLAEYAGDTLWALLVFLGVGTLRPNTPLLHRGAMALGFAFVVEVSQLYHAPWIDAIRATKIGGLILGFGFLWTDLVCYVAGVLIGVCLDRTVRYLTESRAS